METDFLEPEKAVDKKHVVKKPGTVGEKKPETIVHKPGISVGAQSQTSVETSEKSEHKKSAKTSVKKGVRLPRLVIAKTNVSGDEDDQSKKPEATEKDSNTSENLTVDLPRSATKKSPLVQTGSPSGNTVAPTLKSALSNWKFEARPGGGWQRSQGGDQLTFDGRTIKGRKGSEAEVEGMFEVARDKNWSSMAFNGTDEFKRKVIETALKSGYAVKTFNDNDLAIVKGVLKKMEQVKKRGESPSNENPALNATGTNRRAAELPTLSRNADAYSKSAQSAEKNPTKTAFKNRAVSLP